MFNYYAKKTGLFIGFGALLFMGSFVFAVDLQKEGETVGGVKDVGLTHNIVDEMEKPTVGYVGLTYKKSFILDPFGEATLKSKDMSKKLRIAGIENVKDALSLEECSLPETAILSLVYNFVPEFRSEVAKNIKEGQGNFDNRDYVFEIDSVEEYCKMYFTKCAKKDEETGSGGISSKTPDNVMANCQEFFKEAYEHGHDKQRLVQNLYIANLGADKYRNTKESDSPYDIMVDLGTYAKVMFQDAENPVEITFYTQEEDVKTSSQLQAFQTDALNGSMNSALEEGVNKVKGEAGTTSSDEKKGNKNSGNLPVSRGTIGGSSSSASASTSNGGKNSGTRGVVIEGQTYLNGEKVTTNGGNTSTTNGTSVGSSQNGSTRSLPTDNKELAKARKTYENLLNQLEGQQGSNGGVAGLGNSCEGGGGGGGGGDESDDEEPILEPEGETSDDEELEFTVEEYQELVDYMLDAMEQYTTLSEEKEEEIAGIAGDTSRYVNDQTADELERSAKEIKNCWQKCEGLRIDQKATCMLKCACGEIESPIFDPDKTPGLGPIFIIRYCAVPGKYKKISLGSGKIQSVEESLDQVKELVNKLSREARLGVWTQQYEFLDSSTKKMNIATTVAFTIDVEYKDISNDDEKKKSEQYKKREAEKQNQISKVDHNVAQPLDNPATKNNNMAIASTTDNVGDVVAGANSDVNRNAVSNLEVPPARVITYLMNGDAQRYSMLGSDYDALLEQWGEFWKEVHKLLVEINNITIALLNKPECGCSNTKR